MKIKLKNIVENIIRENSLSRVTEHMKTHDCGIMTAFRSRQGCGTEEDPVYTYADNKKRNSKLLAMIGVSGYDHTMVNGVYIEEFGTPAAHPVSERSFFIVDVNDTGKLKTDLLKWGEEFDQDSIMFIPKMSDQRDFKSGAFTGGSIMIGTNKCEGKYFQYHTEYPLKDIHYGKEVEFMTKVNDRPFSFTEGFMRETVHKNSYKSSNWLGKMAVSGLANGDWRKLKLNEELQ
jgi:nitrogen regulatory protein PII